MLQDEVGIPADPRRSPRRGTALPRYVQKRGHRRPAAEALISRWSVSVAIENDARFTVCHICFSAAAEANFVPGPSLARNIGSVPAAAQLTFWGVAEEVGGNNRETWFFALFLRILAQ